MRKQRTLFLFLAILMLCQLVLPVVAAEPVESAMAATMQLAKTTGTVGVTNSSGRSLSVRDNMRLYNGYRVETKAKSYAWVNLDDAKLTKLDAVSEAEVRKSGKKLELLLSSGNLYFNVTSPLEEEETLNIRTSTMMVGIRGTSGWVKVIDRWAAEIYILEGTVECSATDPVTGQVKTATLHGGDKAIATAYPQEQVGDKCDIILERFGPGDIDGFVLEELARDPGLCGDIFEESGIDPLPPMGGLESVRRQLEDIREELKDVREQLEGENPSIEGAQSKLDELQQRLEDVKDQLEQAGPGDDAQRRLDEAREHLEQAREALDDGRAQDALDRLDDAREDLEGARQSQAADARQTGEETAQKRLEQDQRELQDKLDNIEDDLSGQDNYVSTDPVWEQKNPDTNTSNGNSGGGSSWGGGGSTPTTTPTPAETSVEGQMPLTAPQVQELLNKNDKVTLLPSDDQTENTLSIEDEGAAFTMTVALGKTLTLSDGIDVVVQDGSFLTVDGTMEGTGTLTNGGSLRVNSGNTLKMQRIENNGVLENTAKGHIIVDTVTTYGVLNNAGTIEGRVFQEYGEATISGGKITNGYRYYTPSGEDDIDRFFAMTGGEITVDDGTDAALVITANFGDVRITGGTLDGGDKPAIYALSYFESIYIGTSVSDEATGSNEVKLRSNKPGSIIQFLNVNASAQYAVTDDDTIYNYRKITSSSILTAIPENGSYRLTNVSQDVDDALNAAKTGEIVTMTQNFNLVGGDVTVSGGSKDNPVVLDLNGYSFTNDLGITVSGALKLCDNSDTGGGSYNSTIWLKNYLFLDGVTINEGTGSGALSVQNGTVSMSNGSTINGSVNVGGISYGDDGATDYGGTFTMYEGSTIKGSVNLRGNAVFTMNGGLIDGNQDTAVTVVGDAIFTINHGEVTSFANSNWTLSTPIATVSFETWSNLHLYGGTITNNDSTGSVLAWSGEGDIAPCEEIKCTIRAKGPWILAIPVGDSTFMGADIIGYFRTENPDDNDYFYLTDENGNIIGPGPEQ